MLRVARTGFSYARGEATIEESLPDAAAVHCIGSQGVCQAYEQLERSVRRAFRRVGVGLARISKLFSIGPSLRCGADLLASPDPLQSFIIGGATGEKGPWWREERRATRQPSPATRRGTDDRALGRGCVDASSMDGGAARRNEGNGDRAVHGLDGVINAPR